MMRVSFCEVSPRSNAARSSGTMIVIASESPMYGSSTARQPAPAAYGSMQRPVPWQRTRFIVGTVTREPSARMNRPGFVSAASNGFSHGALRYIALTRTRRVSLVTSGLASRSGIRPAVCFLTQALIGLPGAVGIGPVVDEPDARAVSRRQGVEVRLFERHPLLGERCVRDLQEDVPARPLPSSPRTSRSSRRGRGRGHSSPWPACPRPADAHHAVHLGSGLALRAGACHRESQGDARRRDDRAVRRVERAVREDPLVEVEPEGVDGCGRLLRGGWRRRGAR